MAIGAILFNMLWMSGGTLLLKGMKNVHYLSAYSWAAFISSILFPLGFIFLLGTDYMIIYDLNWLDYTLIGVSALIQIGAFSANARSLQIIPTN